jgi:hypothetical protein
MGIFSIFPSTLPKSSHIPNFPRASNSTDLLAPRHSALDSSSQSPPFASIDRYLGDVIYRRWGKSNSLAKTIYIYIWYMCICQYGRCKLMLNYYCLLLCIFLYSCLLTLLFTTIVYYYCLLLLFIYNCEYIGDNWWCLLMPTVNPQPKDWNLIRLVTKAGFSSKLFSYWLQDFHFRSSVFCTVSQQYGSQTHPCLGYTSTWRLEWGGW